MKEIDKLIPLLKAQNLKIVTVESCTGGLIGKILTDRAGSSDWFAGGLITYTNESKNKLVGVPESVIKKYGAVSIQVAELMAKGAHQHFDRIISVAVTGIAGPSGGSEEKPVGTVCFGTYYNSSAQTLRLVFDGDRQSVRNQTAKMAIKLVYDRLKLGE